MYRPIQPASAVDEYFGIVFITSHICKHSSFMQLLQQPQCLKSAKHIKYEEHSKSFATLS